MTAKHTVSEYLYPLLIALALLTKLPVLQWLPEQWSDKHQGQSLLYYPAVGLILALLLFVIDCLLPDATAPPVAGIIIVTAWVVLTGALHIDGFADSVDAACAAHRHTGSAHTPTILAVLKDPAAGPMALAATVLLICSKILLMAQMQAFILLALITCLVMARTLALVFMITTPYVNPNGLAANVVKHMSVLKARSVAAAILLLALLCLPFKLALLIGVLNIILLVWWRYFWLKRIGGFVGDCVGALIEMSELLTLFAIYFYVITVPVS